MRVQVMINPNTMPICCLMERLPTYGLTQKEMEGNFLGRNLPFHRFGAIVLLLSGALQKGPSMHSISTVKRSFEKRAPADVFALLKGLLPVSRGLAPRSL